MTASGRTLKRPITIPRQRKLLERYRKRVKKLKKRVSRERTHRLILEFEQLQRTARRCPGLKPIEKAVKKLQYKIYGDNPPPIEEFSFILPPPTGEFFS